MKPIKKQHYVWREYLRAWAQEELINTLLLDFNKIETISLTGVAQERYFYKLVDITHTEIQLLESLIEKSHSSVKGLQSDFLFYFTSFTKLNKLYKENPTPQIKEKLREIEINTMEKAHGLIESHGTKLISCTNITELNQLLSNPHHKNQAIIFICAQFFRTRKIKDAVLEVYKNEKKENIENIWNILSFIMTYNSAMNIAINPNLKFRFLENKSSTNFITSDQPINNLLDNVIDTKGNLKNLELYYPLSPKAAISVHFETSQKSLTENILISEPMVQYFNQIQYKNSLKFLFSEEMEQLVALSRKNTSII